MNLGVPEILIILLVLAAVGGSVIALVLFAGKATRQSRPIHPTAPPPHGVAPGPGRFQDDLATRVRRLKQEGRTDQAIHLVIGETGMGHAEATLFVNGL